MASRKRDPEWTWTTTQIAHEIASRSKLTGSDAYMLADDLSRGPMADLWHAGVTEGKRRARRLTATERQEAESAVAHQLSAAGLPPHGVPAAVIVDTVLAALGRRSVSAPFPSPPTRRTGGHADEHGRPIGNHDDNV